MNIQPHALTAPTATSVRRTRIQITPSQSDPTRQEATVDGDLLDSSGNRIDGISCQLTADEYDAWGSDDTYPTQLLISKNGLTAA